MAGSVKNKHWQHSVRAAVVGGTVRVAHIVVRTVHRERRWETKIPSTCDRFSRLYVRVNLTSGKNGDGNARTDSRVGVESLTASVHVASSLAPGR